jgi:protein-S-isoprenylcysteine O-methyltransferase Ste14
MSTLSLLKLALFLLASAPIVGLSWPSLRNPRSHGFFRFFAFECLLALALLNVGVWFSAPWSPLQILSWLLLFTSAFLALHGFGLLRKAGRPGGSIEATTVLVTSGAYKYIRHPLYASLLYFGCGVFLKHVSVSSGILVLMASLLLYLTARAEERENLVKFGGQYSEFMTRTRMFIPFLF